jgi:hypothetical protein
MYRRPDAAIFIMVVKFRNTNWPFHRSSPFIGELRCQAIQTEHGPYTAERTQKAVYMTDEVLRLMHKGRIYPLALFL